MKKTIVAVVAALTLSVVGTILRFTVPEGGGKPVVVIVEVHDVVVKYRGALDARTSFSSTSAAWQGNIDTLHHELQTMYMDYERRRPGHSAAERTAMEGSIRHRESQVRDNAIATGEKTRAGHRKPTENIVSCLRGAADGICRERDHDPIIGVRDDCGVLFDSGGIDPTVDVLADLSRTYRGEPGRRS